MPHGVSDQFLRILRNERKGSVRAIVLAAALLPLAYFMAELTDQSFLGLIVWLAFLALAAGAAAGVLWARHQTAKYNDSLRQSWNQWMRMSLSCARVDEVSRHVEARGRAAPVAGAGWGALFAANALLFVALWVNAPWAVTLGAAVTVANGLVLGTLAGRAAWSLGWSRRFSKALHEMLGKGEIGMWGEV